VVARASNLASESVAEGELTSLKEQKLTSTFCRSENPGTSENKDERKKDVETDGSNRFGNRLHERARRSANCAHAELVEVVGGRERS
jgi:hypothetical protein